MDQTTELLSTYACDLRFEDLSPQVVHQVERTLVDTLGCAIGGFSSEPGKIARTLASNVSSATPSRILGTKESSAPDMASFANCIMLRYLDCNDSYFSPGGGHPSDMIPAALAMAGARGSDGKTVITAIALAYEVFCRLSDQVVASDFGWDQGIFGVVGATCAAGKVMGLNKKQMGHAISLSVAPNLPLGVTRTGELSMWKGCATASATRAGVFSALLAEQGMTGPDEPFEGRRGLWEQATCGPVTLAAFGGRDEPFRILDTIFKSYPSQIHTQGPIGLSLELSPQVSAGDIDSIMIRAYKGAVSTPATEPEKWDPKTRETADHSIPYLVAAALQDGEISPTTFTTQRIQDPALRTIINKMTIQEDTDFTEKYPNEYNCRIEITSKTGQLLTAHTSFPKGNRFNPLSDSEVEAKFRGLASTELGQSSYDRTLELAWSLDTLPNLDALFDSLVV